MNKQQVYRDIEAKLGMTPTFFKGLQEGMLEPEWQLFQQNEMMEGPVPLKYRQLIGLAVAGAIKCKYCIEFHTQMSRACGASDAEIEDAMYTAKCTTGWSTYLSGLQTDFDQFQREVKQACEHMRSSKMARV